MSQHAAANGRTHSRRDLLRACAATAAAGAIPNVLGAAETPAPLQRRAAATLPALGSRPTIGPVDAAAKSVVAHVRSEQVLATSQVHPSLVAEMVEEALRAVTGKSSGASAWNALLRTDDVIGIKFNHVAATSLATTPPFATQLVDSLKRAGFAPARIMLIEAPSGLAQSLGTRAAPTGWSGGKVSFASGEEELAAVLQEVTAIINVPFLKTHNLAGMSGSLKNLSHAMIRRPGRYHADACSPFIPDIVALPQIRSKLRVHIVNALRAVFDGGPEATTDTTWAHRGVIVSTDPVAADSVGLDIINDHRTRLRLPAIGDALGRVPHLRAAAERGLGTDDQDYITLVETTIG